MFLACGGVFLGGSILASKDEIGVFMFNAAAVTFRLWLAIEWLIYFNIDHILGASGMASITSQIWTQAISTIFTLLCAVGSTYQGLAKSIPPPNTIALLVSRRVAYIMFLLTGQLMSFPYTVHNLLVELCFVVNWWLAAQWPSLRFSPRAFRDAIQLDSHDGGHEF